MTHVLQITEGPTRGHYLKGPRTPADVRRLGYAFTNSTIYYFLVSASPA